MGEVIEEKGLSQTARPKIQIRNEWFIDGIQQDDLLLTCGNKDFTQKV